MLSRVDEKCPDRQRRVDWFVLFLVILAASCFVIELVDPAPMDVEAELSAGP